MRLNQSGQTKIPLPCLQPLRYAGSRLCLQRRTEIRNSEGLPRAFQLTRIRAHLRGCPSDLAAWLKKAQHLQPLETTLVPAQPEDVLELDELWSFVQCLLGVWVELCRRTRQVVSWFAGDPERGQLPPALGGHLRSLPGRPHLQRLLASLPRRVWGKPPIGRQGNRTNSPY